VLVDPLSIQVAQWLTEEFQRRFPPGTVKYVLHTNHRFDRAEGASIFSDPAELVGQREFNTAVAADRRLTTPSAAVSDHARDKDRDGDGQVTSDELYRRVRDVESQFDHKRVITLGGRTIEMISAATEVLPDNSIINFPGERTAFASEAPLLDGSPFSFGNWPAVDVRHWLTAAASLDFDNLVLADGRSIPKARITALSSDVKKLLARAVEDYEAGRSPARLADARFSVFRGEFTLGGLAHYAFRDPGYCGSSDTCSTGGLVRAATTSLSVGVDRWAAVGEFSVSDNSFTTRTSRFVDEDFALVESRTSVMMRYSHPMGAISYRLLGGLAFTVGDRRGLYRFKEGLPPFAGRHPLESHRTRFGYTGGIDLVIGHRLGLVVPLRFTYSTLDTSGTFPHRMDAQAGISLTMRLFRAVL
jgi:hypothetical protein